MKVATIFVLLLLYETLSSELVAVKDSLTPEDQAINPQEAQIIEESRKEVVSEAKESHISEPPRLLKRKKVAKKSKKRTIRSKKSRKANKKSSRLHKTPQQGRKTSKKSIEFVEDPSKPSRKTADPLKTYTTIATIGASPGIGGKFGAVVANSQDGGVPSPSEALSSTKAALGVKSPGPTIINIPIPKISRVEYVVTHEFPDFEQAMSVSAASNDPNFSNIYLVI